jgi:hypothetical protein
LSPELADLARTDHTLLAVGVGSVSFRAYLKSRPLTADAEGEFVIRAQADMAFPDFTLWSQLETYMIRSLATDRLVEASRRVWGEYIHMQRARGVRKK